jgi:uncharacterized protein (DUF2141 family)
VLFLLLTTVSVIAIALQQQKVKLYVTITNITTISGKLQVAVYNSKKDFLDIGGEYMLKSIEVNNNLEKCVFFC